MKQKFFLIITLLVIGLSSASAQVVWGVRVGVSRPTASEAYYSGNNVSTDGIFGLEIGPVLYYSLKNNFYLNSGLMYSIKTFKEDESSLNFSYFELPINIGYVIPVGKFNTYFQAGPYFGYNLSANVKDSNTSISIKEYINSLNAGLGIMYGINIDRFKIELGYQFGLAKAISDNDLFYDTKFNSLFIGVSYVF